MRKVGTSICEKCTKNICYITALGYKKGENTKVLSKTRKDIENKFLDDILRLQTQEVKKRKQ